MASKILALAAPVFLVAACATPATQPLSEVPDALRPTASERLLMVLAAKGVQVYECRAKADKPGAAEWAFVAPQAELFDARGKLVGKHYGGPSWEAADGSKLVGAVKARADAPEGGAIPWLLLSTTSVGAAGAFSAVTSIQRVNTVGGAAPPADGCTTASVGRTERVGYTADYRLWGVKA
jgi:hypothetical protein